MGREVPAKVTMTRAVVGEDGEIWEPESTQTPSRQFAIWLIERGKAVPYRASEKKAPAKKTAAKKTPAKQTGAKKGAENSDGEGAADSGTEGKEPSTEGKTDGTGD